MECVCTLVTPRLLLLLLFYLLRAFLFILLPSWVSPLPFLISRLIFFTFLALSYASFRINYMFQRVQRTMLMDSIFEGNKLWIYYSRSNYILLSSWFCQDLKISALSNSQGVLRSRLIWIQNCWSYRRNVYLLNVWRSVSKSKIIILFLHFPNEASF